MAKLLADFTDVKSGGRVRIPEGDYRAKVTDVKVGTAKSSGNTMLIWEFTISEGKHKGKKFKDYTTLNVEALWKLKGLLEVLGLKIPNKKVDLTPVLKKVKGKELGITVADDDEYENKINSKIADYIDLETLEDFDSGDDDDESEDEASDDDDDDDEEDEKPKSKKKGKGKKSKKKKEDDDDDEIEDLELDEL